MKIYSLFEEKDLKKIERTVILEWQNIQQLGTAIIDKFHKDEDWHYYNVAQNSKEVIEFKNYCRSRYELLETIQTLLIVSQKHTHELEAIIVQKLIDYITERLKSMTLMCEILEDENGVNCTDFCYFSSDLLFNMRIILPIEEV